MKRTTLAVIAAVPLALLAAACSSSSSSTASGSATHSATPTATSMTGTEVMKGTVTGKAVIANTATYHLTLTGPVSTTGTWTSPNGNATKVTTPAGNLVVNADAPDANNPPTASNASTCLFKSTIHATYVVDGAKSTGKFAGATGSGDVAVTFAAYTPKLSNGKCNTSNSAQPLAAGAVSTFTATGPLTIKI